LQLVDAANTHTADSCKAFEYNKIRQNQYQYILILCCKATKNKYNIDFF
jgi:hypothetical protein